MKRRIVYSIFLNVVCVVVLFSGCVNEPISTPPKEHADTTPTESIYTEVTGPDEFGFVVVGKTSFNDVLDARPDKYAGSVMTDRAFLEYQKPSGGYIRITFQGEEPENMIVSAIEEVSQSVKDVERRYTEEDFSSVVVGKSTLRDVSEIAYFDILAATSYGSLCELPLADGRYIQIAFTDEDVVKSIKIVDESTFNNMTSNESGNATP